MGAAVMLAPLLKPNCTMRRLRKPMFNAVTKQIATERIRIQMRVGLDTETPERWSPGLKPMTCALLKGTDFVVALLSWIDAAGKAASMTIP